jgi:hypothetical protein
VSVVYWFRVLVSDRRWLREMDALLAKEQAAGLAPSRTLF